MSESLLSRFLPARWNGNGRKSLSAMPQPVGGGGGSLAWLFADVLGSLGGNGNLQATKVDYAARVGDGMQSSVLAAPLNFIMRTFPEAPPIVEQHNGDMWQEEPQHALERLLRKPNDSYSGRVLFKATALDYTFGNAYWIKIRGRAGEPVQLWYAPRQLMTPRWATDGSQYVDHFDFRSAKGTVKIAPQDVVHFRFGLDQTTRMGRQPLSALYRDIYVDDQAASFTASILENLGIVGLVVSPKEGAAKDGAYNETKEYFEKNFTGDKRGKVLALSRATDVQLLQYNLQGFDVAPIRDVSEERICAALGIPAAVVGFGTGLHQTKVGATMKEMRQLAWTGGIIPMQEDIADEITRSLVPEFESQRDGYRMRFDTTKVRALWEDTNERHARIREDYKARLIDRATALREMGRAAQSADVGIYYEGPPAQAAAPVPASPTAKL